MLRQYFEAKDANPGVLMAIRVGDFYEFYGEDAESAARALEITLTGREDGSNGRIPMAGVPFHSVEKYLARLVQQGFKVALCDQLEDPKQAKGLVKRGVTRVITPGTLMDDSMLSAASDNFVCAVVREGGVYGLALLDPSTGALLATEVGDLAAAMQEVARLKPSEILHEEEEAELATSVRTSLRVTATCRRRPMRPTAVLDRQFQQARLAGFGLDIRPAAVVAVAMVIEYASGNGLSLSHVDVVSTYSTDEFMTLDPATRRSLEITQNVSDGSRKNTLLSALDCTVTPMGARLLRRWLDQPSLSAAIIRERHEAVARLIEHALTRGDIRSALTGLYDIERLVGRAASGLAGPRDMVALRKSLQTLPELEESFFKVALGRLATLRSEASMHEDLAWQLDRALNLDVPVTLRDGGVIRDGFDPELDALRGLQRNGKEFIATLEREERGRTGIDRLKVGYNSVFGYYLEVPKAASGQVPADYIRKQTTANAERYITAALKDQESQVLGAEEKALQLEMDLFVGLRNKVAAEAGALLQTARALAELDVLCAFAEAAVVHRYVRPEIVEDDVFEVDSGRHAVVEQATDDFVPNDLNLDERRRLMILTGPNMSGKSTFLRQCALMVVMAQAGSFVPAASLRMGLCDRVFARIGARDEIALGQSTFMVEMIESANILNNASARSLVILDEVGRGTSTFDGLAIAWAMVEHLADTGCKCLFATHYHQLNSLAETVQGVFNCRVAVEEEGERVVWTHRVLPGGTDRSYGVQVARMAGVPRSVLTRATEVLRGLEGEGQPVEPPRRQTLQMTLFDVEPSPILTELQDLDVQRLTPLEALMKLDEWKRKL